MSLQEKFKQITNGWVKATTEQFSNHPIANLVRRDLVKEVQCFVERQDISYLIKSSAGAGNWASVPWISILDSSITKSTQAGIYPVYLFCADGSGVYLSLGFGTNDLIKQHGLPHAKIKAAELREELRAKEPRLHSWADIISLGSNTSLGRSYDWASAGAKYYPADSIPDDKKLYDDLNELLEIYAAINDTVTTGNVDVSVGTVFISLSKPFMLLAGISGTGKTRFVREQAKATGSLAENYCLTPVRPDWHEPSDLLGYTSHLNGKAEYITTDVLQFIAKAWRAKADAGLALDVEDIEGHGKCFVASGEATQLDSVLPYWLCLDEMNLAPVEQYFADYLSILETREWRWTEDHFKYLSDALLKSATIKQLKEPQQEDLRKNLGFSDHSYNELWDLICEHGMGIPFNLIVAGTVNMDETTHGFSRKVIDRALSFDFGKFFPNVFSNFFESSTRNKTLSYPVWSHAIKNQLPVFDGDGQKSIDFLNTVNAVLDNTSFKLAYRALNELLLAVISEQPESSLHLKAIWDDFLMCKVLPRIEGDSDKLMTDSSGQSLLQKLSQLLEIQFSDFWSEVDGANDARPDLYRERADTTGSDKVLRIACRSKEKLEWMQDRLDRSGFTSFWP